MAAVVLLTGVAVSIARCGREKEINVQVMAMKEEQTRQELRMQQEYGCDIYGQYEYPYNTMSQDWSGDQVEGFYYHEITEECKKAGGQFPVIMQVYTYIICEQKTVPAEQLPYDVLAAYNYGLRGAQKNLWAYGVHEYEYNRAILKRAQELKQETKEAKEEKQ